MEPTEDELLLFARQRAIEMIECWKQHGFTEAQFAELLGLDLETVERLGRGTYWPPPAVIVYIVELQQTAGDDWVAELERGRRINRRSGTR